MPNNKIQVILNEEIEKIKPSEKESSIIKAKIHEIREKLGKKLHGKATIILGGSFAKNTVIKKERYDVDLFVRFFKSPNKKSSDFLEKSLKSLKLGKIETLHGSRDYFKLKIGQNIFAEIVPIADVRKVGVEKAENVTDVSPLHVDYIQNKLKKDLKLADEIRLAKAFCYAIGCYGAESHIRGFSGYCLEILVTYYKGFLNLLKESMKWPVDKKVIIDPEKYYKTNEVMNELNESKLISPLIIVDPVQKNRNVSAALSEEKLLLFKESGKKFLARPSLQFFETESTDDFEDEIKKKAKKSGKELLIIKAESKKKKEDIAGAKLLKFYKIISLNLEKEGYSVESKIKFKDNRANFYFLLGKKDVLMPGPFLEMEEHVKNFKKRWKHVKIRGKRIYAVKKASEISWKKALKFDKKFLEDIAVKNFVISVK